MRPALSRVCVIWAVTASAKVGLVPKRYSFKLLRPSPSGSPLGPLMFSGPVGLSPYFSFHQSGMPSPAAAVRVGRAGLEPERKLHRRAAVDFHLLRLRLIAHVYGGERDAGRAVRRRVAVRGVVRPHRSRARNRARWSSPFLSKQVDTFAVGIDHRAGQPGLAFEEQVVQVRRQTRNAHKVLGQITTAEHVAGFQLRLATRHSVIVFWTCSRPNS